MHAWVGRGARGISSSGIPERRTAGFWNNVSVCCGNAGVAGATIPGVEGFASAVFPVLFIGLAALASRTRSYAFRAAMAAAITAVICFTLPDVRALAPVIAGVAMALPDDPR